MKKGLPRYLAKLAALLFAAVLPFIAYFIWVQSLPPVYSGSVMGTIHYKIELLQQTPSPRVIFVGGSSSPYGTNCEQISEDLGLPCINVGATAYFGVEYYTNLLSQNTRAGDIVVIAPEGSMLSGKVIYKTLWCGVENSPAALATVPLAYWPKMAGTFYAYAHDKLEIYSIAEEEGVPPTDGQQYHGAFGPLGDVTAYRETLLGSGWNKDDPIALSVDILDEDVLRALNRYARKARRAGATVYFTFAPVDALAVTTAPEEWDAMEQALRDRLDMPVLGTLRAAVMDGKYFYDSNNHLTTEGAALYSAALAGALQEAGVGP